MQVKVCNLREDSFDRDFINSVTNTGFAVITHHGIDQGLIKEVQSAWRMFFLSDNKKDFINVENDQMGYHTFKKEKAVGAKVADLKEFFHWKPGHKMPHETWALTQHLYYQLEDVGMRLLKTIDDIGNTKYQDACWNSDNTLLRTLYYPALDFEAEKGAVRAAAHEDINFITLLVAASAPGLEVLDKEGNWHEVPHTENSIVVNIGDMLDVASNGRFRSTTHRVVNPSNSKSDRVSIPLFIHPHSDTLLREGLTAGGFLEQRLKEIGLK